MSWSGEIHKQIDVNSLTSDSDLWNWLVIAVNELEITSSSLVLELKNPPPHSIDWNKVENTLMTNHYWSKVDVFIKLLNDFPKFSVERVARKLREIFEKNSWAEDSVFNFLIASKQGQEVLPVVSALFAHENDAINSSYLAKLREVFPEILTEEVIRELEVGVSL